MENHKLDPTLHVTDEESEDQRGKGTCPCTDDSGRALYPQWCRGQAPFLLTILVMCVKNTGFLKCCNLAFTLYKLGTRKGFWSPLVSGSPEQISGSRVPWVLMPTAGDHTRTLLGALRRTLTRPKSHQRTLHMAQ